MIVQTNSNCIRPSLNGPDPDAPMVRDMLDELGRMRRHLAGMVGQTESAQRHRNNAPGTPGANRYSNQSRGRGR